MATMTLEALQNELIRELLDVRDINLLKKVCDLLRHETPGYEVAEPTSVVAEDQEPYMSKEEILANFDHACKELKLNLEGKLEFKTLKEALDEL